MKRSHILWGPFALATVVSCSALTGGDERQNPALCPQTYEFGNYGCARVEGRVVDSSGQPVVGATIRLDPAEGTPGIFDTPVVHAGDDGFYRMEIHAYHSAPPIPGSLDFVARTFYRGTSETGVSTEVPIRLEFVPVGERVTAAILDVVLAVP